MLQISQDDQDLGPTLATWTRKDKWTPQELATLIALWADGVGVIEIGDQLGRS